MSPGPVTGGNCRESGLGVGSSGEALQGLEISFLSVSHCLCPGGQTVHQTLALLLWSFRDITHCSSAQDGISFSCLTACGPPTLVELSYIHNSIPFPPVSLSYVHLINRPAKSTQKERKVFLLYTCKP